MYVCMYVRYVRYVRMYVCTYVRLYVRMRMYVFMCVLRMYVCIVCMYVHMYVLKSFIQVFIEVGQVLYSVQDVYGLSLILSADLIVLARRHVIGTIIIIHTARATGHYVHVTYAISLTSAVLNVDHIHTDIALARRKKRKSQWCLRLHWSLNASWRSDVM